MKRGRKSIINDFHIEFLKNWFEEDQEGEFIEIDDEIYKLIKLTPVFNSNILISKTKGLFILLRGER